MSNPFRTHWRLNPDVDFLNHGSFGATPIVVMEAQRAWMERLERDPIEFLGPERALLPKLDRVRDYIGRLVGADPADLAFVRNATEGVNAVLRSFPFSPGDEVVITNHGYNACNNAARYAAERCGAVVSVAELPFPIESNAQVIEAIDAMLTSKTRLLLIDHVTSPTGLVLPVKGLIELARRRGVRVMVDGAHAPGMVPVDLSDLDPDYYTGNHHKWLCGPKTSGFLYVRREWQHEVRPTTISHGANSPALGRTPFLAEFNWVGTYDPTPILSMPAAVEFLSVLKEGGFTQLMRDNHALVLAGRHALLDALGCDLPAPAEMLGSLASVPLSAERVGDGDAVKRLQHRIYHEHAIEVPIFLLNGTLPCLRISAQAYNSLDQYERLADALRVCLDSKRS
ncbi:aminotransferase class V-fold PLP-dependent enzyme [Stieleria sp. ICT_E10.1]|uniref:aminotransferase class V-fold PLP-dependent enzyme n=1 Tax=Stieleria sedimenti TaxID=2976331 RepID=UPI0021809650|nr:aminotransferase class V-fold PLP-dependent enzyme [Stieleria sedimenti]MCS7470819.1 aminotransferase class V-fold PLP-dependent enzyme [Stieleria sedimenti]